MTQARRRDAHPCYNTCRNELKIQKIGNSAGVILPKDLLAHLEVEVGQVVSVAQTPHGIELLTPDADFEAHMAAAREVMARRRRALRELAKSTGDPSIDVGHRRGGHGGACRAAGGAWRRRRGSRCRCARQRDGGADQPCRKCGAGRCRPRRRLRLRDRSQSPVRGRQRAGRRGRERTFLRLNSFTLDASDAEVVVAFLALAAGEFSEAEVADWFRERAREQGG